MSDGISVTMTGLTEMQVKLQSLPEKVARKRLRKAVRDGGRLVRDAAKATVVRRTGRLRRSIREREGNSSKLTAVSKVFVQRGKNQGGYYAHLVEYGHKTRYKHGRYGEKKTVGARPFMRPAYEGNKQNVINIIAAQIWVGLVEEAAKGKR